MWGLNTLVVPYQRVVHLLSARSVTFGLQREIGAWRGAEAWPANILDRERRSTGGVFMSRFRPGKCAADRLAGRPVLPPPSVRRRTALHRGRSVVNRLESHRFSVVLPS